MPEPFDEHRRRIDAIDSEILRLLGTRLDIARQIGEKKRELGIPSYDPARERVVLDRIVHAGGGAFPAEGLRAIYREIISASRALETRRPVSYLGAPGSLAHQAARERFGDSAALEPCDAPLRVFERLASGDAEYAVLTLESASLEAHMDRLDLFLESPIKIFGEFSILQRVHLYAACHDPSTVYAHPAALAACSRWVERSATLRRFVAAGAPEEAVERAVQDGSAAMGYSLLDHREGLHRIESDLEDEPRLYRRYLILGMKDGPPTGRDKTSCLAVIPNRPGGLNEVTSALARHGVNLCWIEPKATRIGTWDHIFFLDVEGHRVDPAVTAALDEVRGCTEWFRVLGSYPSERPPGRSFG